MRLFKRGSHGATGSVSNHGVLCVLVEGDSYVQNQGILTSADLRNCPLVCRAFSEPVLRAMWQKMPSPAALWWLLVPEDKQTTPWIPTKDLCEKVLNAEQCSRSTMISRRPTTPGFSVLCWTTTTDTWSVPPSKGLWYSHIAYIDTRFYSILTPRLQNLRLTYSRALDTTIPLCLPSDLDFEGIVSEVRLSVPGLQHLRIEPYVIPRP
ncbi:hypothetical protein BD310DRAFT_936522 [Dichomitus squalens]|uniref:Uncharacterized protein n=1 Tax=Dichomitus squalens TaxID=114155 RepID=A0A4Q9PJB9_9APHY|nr:hypothetical protein BD310DRAFT_936522 [Dichomitus squalens]